MSTKAAFAALVGLSGAPEPGTQSEFSDGIHAPPAVQWHRDLPGLPVNSAAHTELGTPLLYGDQLFLGSAGSNYLYVLDRDDGTLEHRYSAKGPVQSKPVIQDGKVFFADAAGYMWCYPLGGDDPVWQHYGGAPILAPPVITGKQVLISNVGNAVYSLLVEDGSLNWRHVQERDATRRSRLELYSSPSPVVNGEEVLVGFHDGSLVGLSLDAGDRLWQRQVGEGRYPDLLASPVLHGTDAIVAGFEEPLMSLELNSRNVRWRLDSGGTHPVTVNDGWVYHGGGDGNLRSINPTTGSVRWTWEAPRGGALSQPISTPAGLLIASNADSLYLVDEEDGSLEWTLSPGYRLSGVTAGIAVDGRQVVIVTNAGRVMSLVVPQASARVWESKERLPMGSDDE